MLAILTLALFGLDFSAAEILAIAGVISAIGGFVSTIMTARRTRKEEQLDCEEKLRASQREATDLITELYELNSEALERKRKELEDLG